MIGIKSTTVKRNSRARFREPGPAFRNTTPCKVNDK
ncbi:MAG: hypothetical protein QOH32_4495 [Bradyrhizobium sp.]|nr:hypothetical protein [Bradyrhizobium sp.]